MRPGGAEDSLSGGRLRKKKKARCLEEIGGTRYPSDKGRMAAMTRSETFFFFSSSPLSLALMDRPGTSSSTTDERAQLNRHPP